MISHALKNMPFAIARDDGTAIKFKFVAHSGKKFEFECPPDAVPEIVGRLLGVLKRQHRRPIRRRRSNPAEVVKSQVGMSANRQHVTVVLYPTPHCGIGFALTPSEAQTISSLLAAAVSMIAPKDPTLLS